MPALDNYGWLPGELNPIYLQVSRAVTQAEATSSTLQFHKVSFKIGLAV